MSNFSRLIRQARESGLAFFFNLLSSLLTALFVIAQAYLLASAINHVFLQHASLADVLHYLVWIAALALGRAFLTTANEVSARQIAVRVKGRLRTLLLKKIADLGPVAMSGEKRGEVLHTLFEGVEALDAFYSQFLPQVVLSALIPLVVLIAVFPLEPLSGVIMLVTAPLIPFFMEMIGRLTRQVTGKQWNLMSKLSSHFYDTLQGLELLKQYNRDQERGQQIEETDHLYRQATLGVLRFTFLSALVLELVATISTAILAVSIGLRLIYGRMEFLPGLFILILAPEYYLPLRQLSVRFHASMSGLEAAVGIFKLLDEKSTVSVVPASTPPEGWDANILPIRFEKVSAGYDDSQADVLEDISFEIQPGQHLALVGPSGVGKSTLFNLLLRFIPISGGTITAGNLDLTRIPSDLWLRRIAWVPQSPTIFNDTILHNITLSEAPADEDLLEQVLRTSGLWDWVMGLPQTWSTPAGERGAGISTGQAQRLAIARALYKRADLVLLDEPTSAVDPILEGELQQAVEALLAASTTLTIAHRLPTIYRSDRILFLQDGRLVESGSHNELIRSAGAYAQLVRSYTHAH
jgi:ATP-binding cassette, subfamily C, bacterial CydD